MTKRAFTTHPLVVRQAEVRRIREVTPRMRRLTVSGAELSAFERDGLRHPAFAAPGFDDHLKLIFAADGDIAGALPTQLPHGIEWRPSANRIARDYTPRRVGPTPDGEIEIDLDFVLHEAGAATAWARSARIGDRLWFVGPKSSTVLPADLDWVLLAGDETALPAIGRFLDERPVDAPVRVVVTVTDRAAAQDLALRDEDRVEWVVGGADALEVAVRAVDLPPGTGYAWAAAESRALLPVRRYVLRELEMPKSHVNITGYWQARAPHGTANPDAGSGVEAAPAQAVAGATPEPAGQPAPAGMSSPLAWLATRAALQLGLVDAVADSPGQTPDALAARLGVAAEHLTLLLPVLDRNGVVATQGIGLSLGPVGDELIDDEHMREELVGIEADALLALAELAPAMRSRSAPWGLHTRRTLADTATRDRKTYDELIESAEILTFLLDGFVAEDLWQHARTAACTGPGAGAVVDAVTAARPALAVEVIEGSAGLDALRNEVAEPDRIAWSSAASSAADIAVATFAFAHRTDAESGALFGQMRAWAPRAVAIEASRPDALSPRAAESALRAFALTGSPRRDADALVRLATPTGWNLDRVTSLGWGVEAIWLVSG